MGKILRWRGLLLTFSATIILTLDQLSKLWTVQNFPMMSHFAYPYGGMAIFQNFYGIEFSWVYAINRGAAWGILANFQFPLLLFRIGLISVAICYLLFFNRLRARQLPLILIIAGAIGNVIDYFLYGYVIDMFHFVFWGYHYPVFNVADSAIFLGIFWLFFAEIWQDKKHEDCTC